jgi:tRNA-specific 2-thiouridylase
MRVAIGMSGGVDSSVAALLIKGMGFDAVGVTMRVYGGGLEAEGFGNACYGPDEENDVRDARNICGTLGIPFREVDLRFEFNAHVLAYFKTEYMSGRTPNPCVRCNQLVKFGLLVSKLAEETGLGFDRFATGHYARCGLDPARGRHVLRKGADTAKDQSYFLCMLSQEQLSRCMFPLGDLTKGEVRRIACENGLATHDKAESQDFAGGDYRAMLGKDGGREARAGGKFKDSQGRVLGGHAGIWSYTIGQRRGLGISAGEPMYVTGIDRESNTVYVGPASELYKSGLIASGINWVGIAPPLEDLRASVRIRYRHAEAPALVSPRADGSVSVRFDEPQRSIAAGQWAVIYDGDVLLGGGVIEKSF